MADILAFPAKPEDHLRTALRRLDEALAEQKRAIAEFRGNIAGLGSAVSGLGASMDAYRDTLAETSHHVAVSNAAARRLEATADIWLNQAR